MYLKLVLELSAKLWPLFLVTCWAVLVSGCYITRQAWHHAGLLSQRRDLNEVIQDTNTSSVTRDRLKRVINILEYARKEGLNVEDSYESFIETKSPVVSYLVQAAEADQLKFKTWWFPVVGDVPYIGFYDKGERDELAAELEQEGYDVKRGAAGAYSSLGWFQDPLFSSMIQRSYPSLAHLLFHELTHRTLWIQGSAEFNENLAEYIGHLLTIKYLEDISLASEIPEYQARLRDRERLRQWLVELKSELERVYATTKSKTETLKIKAATISKYVQGSKVPKFEVVDLVSKETWNNASILAAVLYAPDRERFEKAHRCFDRSGRSIAKFLKALEEKVEALGEPDKALDGFCQDRKS